MHQESGRRAQQGNKGSTPASWLYLRRTVRKSLLGIVIAAIPIATTVGLITAELAPMYITLAASILLPGLAATDQVAENTNTADAFHDGKEHVRDEQRENNELYDTTETNKE